MLGLTARLSKLFGPGRRARSRGESRLSKRRLVLEVLEGRELLSGLGTDYTLMGGQWDNSRPVSFSVAPDGVNWDQGTNEVNGKLNSEFSGAGWQSSVAQALQTWAASTNLNFTRTTDGYFDFNAPGVNQGDPKFGDIRVGGYAFGTAATIARTYGPPPNGQTGAGDVELNTNFNFAPGSNYDFQTVMLHELGHSLGLGESPQPTSVMYTYYSGVRQALSPYDVEGIQSIYGPRAADAFQSQGVATSSSTALDLSPQLNSSWQGQIAGLSLPTIGATEYFSVVSPQLNGSSLSVAAIAQGFSLLSPKVSVIDPSSGALLASDAHPDQSCNIALATAGGVQPGHRYIIAVTGATGDVFSVGSYGVQFGFFGGTARGIAPDPFPYNNPLERATELGRNTQPTFGNLTLPSGSNYQLFTFQVTQSGLVNVGVLGANALVVDATGRELAWGTGLLGFRESQPWSRYYLLIVPPNGLPVYNYAFAVRTPFSASTGSIAAMSTPVPTPPLMSTTVSIESVATTGSASGGPAAASRGRFPRTA